jgi:acyl carrier protein
MGIKEKLKRLAELFEVEEEDLFPEKELNELDNWDSMMKLSLIVMMDDDFGKKLSANELRQFKTIGDIIAFMD